jgi:hypothetical protein
MRKGLTRNDIVGQSITALSAQRIDLSSDVSAARLFVKLGSGEAFETSSALMFGEADLPIGVPGIPTIDFAIVQCGPAAFSSGESCDGDVVREVVISDQWPSFGLLLASDRFLFLDDEGWGAAKICPCLTPVGDRYKLEDMRTFWGGISVRSQSSMP